MITVYKYSNSEIRRKISYVKKAGLNTVRMKFDDLQLTNLFIVVR
ncbi:hypothetical protein C4J89_0867 [Pseudomonas sp. R4-35-07]|nr:hypothetical protein C4J89_0867 [Pseudomonas sp. R4-35-07]